MALALVAYGALFALLGVLLKRPVIPGLMFLYGWELLANLPGLPAALHAHRLAALARPPPAGRGGARRPLPAGAARPGRAWPSWSASRSLLLAAAAWIFSTREYVLEQ